jgi:hypothetical protein
MDYIPRTLVLTPSVVSNLLHDADFCIRAARGVPIGTRVTIDRPVSVAGRPTPKSGATLKCVGHSHNGKIAVLEDEPARDTK